MAASVTQCAAKCSRTRAARGLRGAPQAANCAVSPQRRAVAAPNVHFPHRQARWTLLPNPPSPSTAWSRSTRPSTAVDGISFALPRGSITGAARRQRRRQDHHHRHDHGPGDADLRHASRVLGADMPRERYRVLHRMNFESPYVDMPMRLTVRQNLKVFGMLYGVDGPRRRASRELAARARSDRSARPADRQAVGRAEDPRRRSPRR